MWSRFKLKTKAIAPEDLYSSNQSPSFKVDPDDPEWVKKHELVGAVSGNAVKLDLLS